MKQPNHLKQAFPNIWTKLDEARQQDSVLAEVCSDFERLSDDLESARTDPKRMSDGLRKDVVDSIGALEQEAFLKLYKMKF